MQGSIIFEEGICSAILAILNVAGWRGLGTWYDPAMKWWTLS
jgi:hypothetical protein